VAVGGYQPVGGRGRPGGPAVVRAERDRTPTAGVRVRQRPNRNYEQRTGPSLVLVGLLLLIATIVVAVLWTNLRSSDPASSTPTLVPAGGAATTVPATAPVPIAPIATAVQARAFDPDGDRTENDDLAPNVLDGNPSTAWNTVCYSDEYLGGKGGVGVVVSLSAPSAGSVAIDIASAPWILEVYSSPAETAPDTIGAWGISIASANGRDPDTVNVPIIDQSRHLLVLLRQLGPSDDCSADNPYRGTLSDVSFTASGT
jgi:hypothetical protein